MSAIIEPPATPPVTPVVPPVTPPARSNLPDGVKIDSRHDATEFFEKHKAANSPAAPAAPVVVAPVAPPVTPAATVPPVTPPKAPADIGGALVTPPAAVTPPVAPIVAPAVTPAANPEDQVTLDPKYSTEAHDSFKIVKGITKQVRETLATRERELSDTKAELERVKTGVAPVETPEQVAMKTENEAMRKRLMVLDLKSTPEYQREFIAPLNAAQDEANNILAANGVTGVDIASLLGKDPVAFRKELTEIAKKLPTALDQADFATAMRNAHSLNARAGLAESKAAELRTALNQQTVQIHKQSFDEAYMETLGSLRVAEVTPPAGSAPEVVAEFQSFNDGVKALRANAERIALGTSSPKEIGRAAIKAAACDFYVKHTMPALQKAIAFRDARITELEGQLAGIKARNPKAGLGGIPHGSGGADPTKMDHHEAAEYFASKGEQ